MRDDIKENLKSIKQQIIAFLTRNGKQFEGKSYWTRKHIDWINTVSFSESLLQDTLKEYMIEYNHLCDRVETLDRQIEEISLNDYSLVIAPVVADLCTTPVALSAPPNSYQNNSQS